MKLLVTGGAGFIGSNFICWWLENHPQDKILNLDKLTYAGDLENLQEVENQPNYQFIQGDICDKKLVQKILAENQPEVLVHFAAESHVTRSEANKDIFYRTNTEGTKNLLECAKDLKIPKFIHISTDEVYGEIKKGYFRESDKKIGDQQATSAYAKSKALADDLARAFGKKFQVIIARPTNNFGPKQYPEKALPRWITNLLLNKKIPVWGKGQEIRDWLYVFDTCKALEILIKKGKVGEAYNIGANNDPEIPNIQVAKWLIEIMDKTAADIEFVPDPRKRHDFRYGVNTNKIKALGWQPSKAVKKNFRETIKWYKNHENWWKKHKQEAEKIYK